MVKVRKVSYLSYHYLVLALLNTYNDVNLFRDVIKFIFDNYHFSVNFCNKLYSFIMERSTNEL